MCETVKFPWNEKTDYKKRLILMPCQSSEVWAAEIFPSQTNAHIFPPRCSHIDKVLQYRFPFMYGLSSPLEKWAWNTWGGHQHQKQFYIQHVQIWGSDECFRPYKFINDALPFVFNFKIHWYSSRPSFILLFYRSVE